MTIPCKKTGDGVLIEIRVQPRSSRNKIDGLQGNTLKVFVTAPPAEGEANRQLIKLLSKEFKIRKSDIEIVKGATSRNKLVLLRGLDHL